MKLAQGGLTIAMMLVFGVLGWSQSTSKVNLEGNAERRAKLASLQGKPAPELEAAEWINGKPAKLSAFKGKVVMLDFWGKW